MTQRLGPVIRVMERGESRRFGRTSEIWQGTGVPQGGPLSPLLSNVVLDELDLELARRGHRFVRYADDCNVFVRSERAGQRVMASIRRFLEGRLRLQVNEEKSAVARPEERHFLGFRLRVRKDGEVGIVPSGKAEGRLDARIRELTPRTWGQSVADCMRGVNVYVRGWMAHFRLCTKDAASFFRDTDAHIRRRLRAILFVQKNRRAHRFYPHLRERGVGRRAACSTAYGGKGAWAQSRSPGMHEGYPNAWFEGRLVSLGAEWSRLNPIRSASGQTLMFGL